LKRNQQSLTAVERGKGETGGKGPWGKTTKKSKGSQQSKARKETPGKKGRKEKGSDPSGARQGERKKFQKKGKLPKRKGRRNGWKIRHLF